MKSVADRVAQKKLLQLLVRDALTWADELEDHRIAALLATVADLLQQESVNAD